MIRGLVFTLSRENTFLPLCSFEGTRTAPRRFPVAIARGQHLFPFRTESLSLFAPMVLGEKSPGRVGRRRDIFTTSPPARGLVAFKSRFQHAPPPPGGRLGGARRPPATCTYCRHSRCAAG